MLYKSVYNIFLICLYKSCVNKKFCTFFGGYFIRNIVRTVIRSSCWKMATPITFALCIEMKEGSKILMSTLKSVNMTQSLYNVFTSLDITTGLDVELVKYWGGRTHRGSVASGWRKKNFFPTDRPNFWKWSMDNQTICFWPYMSTYKNLFTGAYLN